MKIALCTDELYAVHKVLAELLAQYGHEVVPLGACASGEEEPWAGVAEKAGLAVASGDCDQAVLCCWTGTGVCMTANKIKGIRAALCTDAQTAAGARVWNHANVLCLSNRLLSVDVAKEIVVAWLATEPGEQGRRGVALLSELEDRLLR